MKRILLSITLFSCIYLSAQRVIVEEKYEKKNIPANIIYLPLSKKIVVFKGKNAWNIYNAKSYDTIGNSTLIFENQDLKYVTFSPDEISFKAEDHSSGNRDMIKYFVEGKNNFHVKSSEIENRNNSYFGIKKLDTRIANVPEDYDAHCSEYYSFNNFFDLGFTNQKGKRNIDWEKDDIYLEKYNVKTNSNTRFKIDKPDLSLLIGDSFAHFKSLGSFNCRLNSNDTFDLITKSLNKEKTTTILYKDTYNLSGEKINSVSFKLDLKQAFFSLSNNYGGGLHVLATGSGGPNGGVTRSRFDILSINNYYEDKTKGDVYIYGFFSNDGVSNPGGFYIFKFDKNGKKIWESINRIKDYTRSDDYSGLDVSLLEYNKDFIFSLTGISTYSGGGSTYYIIDKNSGLILSESDVNFDYKPVYDQHNNFFIRNYFIFKDNKAFKKLFFSSECFIAMRLDNNIFNYINNLPKDGNRLFFDTIFSDEGIWLIETDNKEYYKVLLFKE